jgi:hypothetical protein
LPLRIEGHWDDAPTDCLQHDLTRGVTSVMAGRVVDAGGVVPLIRVFPGPDDFFCAHVPSFVIA